MLNDEKPDDLTEIFYRDLGYWVSDNHYDDGVTANTDGGFKTDLRDILFGWETGFARCRSPIEQRLFGKLLFLTNGFAQIKYLGAPGIDQRFATVFVNQLTIGPYIADFAFMTCCEGRVAKLIVECDGHDWHEKTKAQAQRDKARDRYCVRVGWKVLRFTGSEIVRNADGCAEEVGEVIYGMTDPLVMQAHDDWTRNRGAQP
jgi:very-short-patch-repair endonuclease